MPIDFSCQNCSTTLRVPEEHIGKQARCPNCQTLNLVPAMGEQVFADFGPDRFPEATKQPATNPYVSTAAPMQTYQTAHRGGLILGMGIMSLVCNIAFLPGILAWILGRSDLKQMKAGTMDREGEGLTQAGMIMGIIMTCLQGIVLLLYFGFIVMILLFGAVGAMQN